MKTLTAILCTLCVVSSSAHAQSDWKRLLKQNLFTTCIEINPLSKGQVIYTINYTSSVKPLMLGRSDDAGSTWTFYPIIPKWQNAVHQIYCLPTDTSILFALGDSLFRSTDGGRTWASVLNIPSDDGETLTYHALSNTLYFTGSDTLRIWKSIDNGATWMPSSEMAIKQMTCTIAVSPAAEATVLSGGNAGSILRSTDGGRNWSQTLPQDLQIQPYPEISKLLFVPAAQHSAMAACWESTTRSLIATTNDGVTWSEIKADSAYIWALEIDPDPAKIKDGLPQHFWTGMMWMTKVDVPDVGETTDGGKTWSYSSFKDLNNGVWVLKYSPATRMLYAASSVGIYAKQIATPESVSVRPHNGQVHVQQSAASSNIRIDWDIAQDWTKLTLRNVLGQIAMQREFNGSSVTFDKTSLAAGYYFCELRSLSGASSMVKILIQ